MSSSSPALQIRVLNALASLILNPKVQDRILKAGVVTQFLGLLNSDSPLLRLLAIKTIDQFSEDPKICEELIQHNLIQTLCSILSSNPNDQFLSHCLKTLIALTIHGHHFFFLFFLSLIFLKTKQNSKIQHFQKWEDYYL